jgi:hypothetical protein
LIIASVSSLIRDQVNERLTSALSVSNPTEDDESADGPEEIITTEEEIAGFNIVRAIGSKIIDPRRIVMRDAKSYCAILLDDNNRKPIVRLHFNSPTARYLGTFVGKEETRHSISDPIELYQHADEILAQIGHLSGNNLS